MRGWFIEETAFWRKLKGGLIGPKIPRNGEAGLPAFLDSGMQKRSPILSKKEAFLLKRSPVLAKGGPFRGDGNGSSGLLIPQALK
jgi:hypothetical protein